MVLWQAPLPVGVLALVVFQRRGPLCSTLVPFCLYLLYLFHWLSNLSCNVTLSCLCPTELIQGNNAEPAEGTLAEPMQGEMEDGYENEPGHSRNSSNTSQMSKASGYSSLNSQSQHSRQSSSGDSGHIRYLLHLFIFIIKLTTFYMIHEFINNNEYFCTSP